MPKILRAQVRLYNASGLPRDIAMNTFHFRSQQFDPLDDVAEASDWLTTLYQGIAQHGMSPVVNSAADITWYALDVPEPRIPIDVVGFTMDVDGSTALPNEVAVCVSFSGAPAAGANPARRRGRIYVGPLSIGVVSTGDFDARFIGTPRSDMVNLWQQFFNSHNSGDAKWVVFSPTSAGTTPWSESALQAAAFDVTHGYIDDNFDTIRSRGTTATERIAID